MRFRGAPCTALLSRRLVLPSLTPPLNSQTQKPPFGMQFAEEEEAIVALWRLTMTKKIAQTTVFGRISLNLFTLRRQRGPFF